MLATAFCLAASMLGAEAGPGIEVGWKPLRDGGVQYILQIDPQVIEALRAGFAAESDVPPEVKDVRSFQLRIGKGGTLPRELPAAPAAAMSPVGGARGDEPLAKGASVPAMPDPAGPKRFTPPEPLATKDSKLPGGFPTPPPEAPPRLLPNLETKPVPDKPAKPGESPQRAKQATFVGEESLQRPHLPGPPPGEGSKDSAAEGKKPWMPLTLALVGLFGSLSGNVYLGWLFWETRQRYRSVLRRKREAAAA